MKVVSISASTIWIHVILKNRGQTVDITYLHTECRTNDSGPLFSPICGGVDRVNNEYRDKQADSYPLTRKEL